jgi:hypothetical protein
MREGCDFRGLGGLVGEKLTRQWLLGAMPDVQ